MPLFGCSPRLSQVSQKMASIMPTLLSLIVLNQPSEIYTTWQYKHSGRSVKTRHRVKSRYSLCCRSRACAMLSRISLTFSKSVQPSETKMLPTPNPTHAGQDIPGPGLRNTGVKTLHFKELCAPGCSSGRLSFICHGWFGMYIQGHGLVSV